MEKCAEEAIIATFNGEKTYCKFLKPNDTTQTQGNQVGPLLTQKAEAILDRPKFETRVSKDGNNVHFREVEIEFSYDYEKANQDKPQFLYYESKKEYRLTNIPHIDAKYVGALFILIKKDDVRYQVFILRKEKDKNYYLNTFGISPAEKSFMIGDNELEGLEKELIDQYIKHLEKNTEKNLPSTKVMSEEARNIFNKLNDANPHALTPDEKILELIRIEYNLFKAFEISIYGKDIENVRFRSIEHFLYFAKKILNSRKCRAGKSLELHLKYLLEEEEKLELAWQPSIDGKKKPDFIFPSDTAYQAACRNEFPKDKIIFLAAKTTCKDRWRQILNEADLLRDDPKYLCTLEKGITEDQLKEMKDANVILVVPKSLMNLYPDGYESNIITLEKFIDMVRKTQNKQ